MNKIQLPDSLASKKIILCEEEATFIAVEGESIHAGLPMLWCRTSNCNLRCGWFDKAGDIVVLCDTHHTSLFNKNKKSVEAQELFNWFTAPEYDHIRWISASGGEPFLQKNLIEVLNHVVDSGKNVKIETNGTIFMPSKITTVMISPKLSSSSSGLSKLADPNYSKLDADSAIDGIEQEKRVKIFNQFYNQHEKSRYNLDALTEFVSYYGPERYHFKFVVNTKEDMQEIFDNYISPLKLPYSSISLMAQGISSELLNNKAQWIIEEYCLKYGFRYTDRLHLRVFGKQLAK
jgi:7-carboxy-7-deazaguanine synthase